MLNDKPDRPLRILLLGASVGKQWNLGGWPSRMKRDDLEFEMVPVYRFDKTTVLQEILIRPKRRIRLTKKFLLSLLQSRPAKPDLIIIKECAAYFPGDMNSYRQMVKDWDHLCREADVHTVLATVVPVTKDHSQEKPGRLEGIREFNQWIRGYTNQQDMFCLDLEKVLQTSDSEGILKDDLGDSDGLHLNPKAYRLLDQYLLDNLDPMLTIYSTRRHKL